MIREYHRWHSPSLERDMEMLIFGRAGVRLLVFPTAMNRYFAWEEHGMVAALAEQLESGALQMFCVDSVDEESWYAWHKHPAVRVRRHVNYEKYILDEVLPLSIQKNANPFLIACGADFGAYHAVNFSLRHPRLVSRVIAMSGMYDVERWLGDYRDDNVCSNCPCLYLPKETDRTRLEWIRRLDIVLAAGENDPNIGNNRWFSEALWAKGIWHAFRVWDGWAHDWPDWQEMIRLYIGGHD